MVQENRHRGFSRLIYLAIVALLALTVRLAPLSRPGTAWMLTPDSAGYIALAKGLRKGCGFVHWEHGACGAPEIMRAPEYPLFLLAIPSLYSAVVAQAILKTGTVVVIGVAAAAVAGTLSGIVATSIFAFDVSSIANCVTIMSEPLFTTIVTLAFGLQIVAVFWFADTRKS